MIIKLFTKKDCPRCPAAKELIKSLFVTRDSLFEKIKIEEFNAETVEGMAEAAFYTVMSTPTILVVDDKGKEVAGWRGEAPGLEELKKVIN